MANVFGAGNKVLSLKQHRLLKPPHSHTMQLPLFSVVRMKKTRGLTSSRMFPSLNGMHFFHLHQIPMVILLVQECCTSFIGHSCPPIGRCENRVYERTNVRIVRFLRAFGYPADSLSNQSYFTTYFARGQP